MAIKPESKPWQAAEMVPVLVDVAERSVVQLDGAYGLYDEVRQTIAAPNELELSPETEEQVWSDYRLYLEQIYSRLRDGQLFGFVGGVAGVREWQLCSDFEPLTPII